MTIICQRCKRQKRVETLGVEHVMSLCMDCFKWLMQKSR